MWTNRRVRTGAVLGAVALAIVMTAGAVWADTTTERPGSILILPKIVASGERDTLIEITNTTNTLVSAHCYYINGAPVNPDLPPGPTNPPLWQEIDFFLTLTRQQPTQWLASQGRRINPFDPIGSQEAGMDPGAIPRVLPGFQGELLCVQTDQSGSPIGGNALTGAATLVDSDGSSSKYNAIAVLGEDVQGDGTLNLDNEEYRACPAELVFPHFAQGAPNPFLGEESQVLNRIALVPCSHDLENGIPAQVSYSVRSYSEFEEMLSATGLFTCRFDGLLDEISATAFLPDLSTAYGLFRHTRLRTNPICVGGPRRNLPCSFDSDCPGGGECIGVVGMVGVLESATSVAEGATSRSSQNLHGIGELIGPTGLGAVIQNVSLD